MQEVADRWLPGGQRTRSGSPPLPHPTSGPKTASTADAGPGSFFNRQLPRVQREFSIGPRCLFVTHSATRCVLMVEQWHSSLSTQKPTFDSPGSE